MAKDNFLSNFDSPVQTQPPKGSAEGTIQYGEVTSISEANDPMGVLPRDAKPRNIGPASKD
jgi:hypothetical protein